MINTPWETASPLYRKLVVGAMSVSGLGIILAIVGANTGNRTLMYTAVGIIFCGLLTHVCGQIVRSRDVRRLRKDNPPASSK